MIVFDLECRTGGHRFEGWFGSSDDFARQQERGLLACPQCGGADVVKAPMAPAIGRKGSQIAGPDRHGQLPSMPSSHPSPQPSSQSPSPVQPMAKGAIPPEALRMMQALATMQAEAIKKSRWVGDGFAEASRAMHYGEREPESIHGEATLEQARALIEEGIEVAPLLFPVAPPGKAN
jgi:hypothetical protein